MKQQSYVMVKPEFANNKKVIAEVKKRLEQNGISILEESYIRYDAEHAKRHYHEHVNKDFYPSLESYIKFHTAENLSAYGIDEISDFNICCEAKGNGEYLVYFLFA